MKENSAEGIATGCFDLCIFIIT